MPPFKKHELIFNIGTYPTGTDRRDPGNRDLRRLIAIGNHIANLLEVATDPELSEVDIDIDALAPDLIRNWRKALGRMQQQGTRAHIGNLRQSQGGGS